MILLKDGKVATREDITEVLELHKIDARLYDDWAITSDGQLVLLIRGYPPVSLPSKLSFINDHPLGTADNPTTLSPDDEKAVDKWYIRTLEAMRAKEAATLLDEVGGELFNGVGDGVVLSVLECDLGAVDWSKPKPKTSTGLSDDELMELLANGEAEHESN